MIIAGHIWKVVLSGKDGVEEAGSVIFVIANGINSALSLASEAASKKSSTVLGLMQETECSVDSSLILSNEALLN